MPWFWNKTYSNNWCICCKLFEKQVKNNLCNNLNGKYLGWKERIYEVFNVDYKSETFLAISFKWCQILGKEPDQHLQKKLLIYRVILYKFPRMLTLIDLL